MAHSKSLVNEWMNLNIQEKSFWRLRHIEVRLAFGRGCNVNGWWMSLEETITEFSNPFLAEHWPQRSRKALSRRFSVGFPSQFSPPDHLSNLPLRIRYFLCGPCPIHFSPCSALFCGPGDWTALWGLLSLLALGWVPPMGRTDRRLRSRQKKRLGYFFPLSFLL